MFNIKKHSFRISYSEAFRAPKPWDYTYELGNADLLPEEMYSIEGAYSFASKYFILDIVAYNNKLQNAISLEYLSEGSRWINSGEVNTQGGEIFLRFSLKKLSPYINYTYNYSFDEFENLVPEIAKHTANAGFTYSLNKYFRINLRANYVGKRENPKEIVSVHSFYVDPYLIFNGSISMINYKGFNVQISVKNILNQEYYHTSNRMPDRYRQPQRTVLFSIGYNINNKK